MARKHSYAKYYEDRNLTLNLDDTGENGVQKQHIPFAIVEAYKTIRTNLLFVLPQEGCKVIVFSSSNVGEGKSTTSINLSIAFAQMGSRVLLIGGDLRRPSVYKKIKIPNTKGLSSYLVGFCELDDIITNINPYLDVMVSGPIPPNPSEMLGSEKMEKTIEALKKRYDYIFIDMPPVNAVSDALILGSKTDGMVFIIQDYVTTHDDIQKAMSSIEFAGVKLLGTVLNGSSKGGRSKYKYRYRYRYRYLTSNRYTYSYSYTPKNTKKK